MARISLLFFAGCPHAQPTRDGLRGFPSPTILLDGAELASGKTAAFGQLCCSAAKAPTPEALAAQLRLRAGARQDG